MNARNILGLALLATTLSATPALAGIGLKLGAGTGIFSAEKDAKEPDGITAFAVGASYGMSLTALEIEVNALYFSTTADTDTSAGKFETSYNAFALPVIARFNMPIIPALLKLGIGGGLEPRFFLSMQVDGKDVPSEVEDQMETMVLYLPISLKGTLDLQVLSAHGEIRYSHQLTATAKEGDDNRVNTLMFFVGASL